MMKAGTAETAVVPERVHGRAGQSRGMHLRRGCSRVCGDDCHTEVDETGRIWRVHSIAVGLSAAAAARQVWRGGELEPDQVGPENQQRVCGLYVCSSTGRYGGRR